MKWTGLNDLRESYLKFFESKGHLRVESAPLVPQDDNSILLINAGMTPLKKYFQGVETPPNNRMTSSQKCIRTPDIENVGKTSRHGTYFEMLGNFSFGDYFKKEAIAWAWEYLTEVLEIPEEKLWVSVYEEDDEAKKIWEKEVGVPSDRIVKMGKEDNFWEHGAGPCGPCSEIYFDRGGEKTGEPDGLYAGYEGDRYVEVWNLVFTEFDSDGKGNYKKLDKQNIDTGMGLERLACAMQDVDNLFEVDTVKNIMGKVSEITGVEYKKSQLNDISLRVITDHIRSTVFMVSDGIRPTNEGRGYVLRRLLRRAARHGKLLGMNQPFLYKVCDTVIDENLSAYPELEGKREYIKKVIKTEEESFAATVDKGSQILKELVGKIGRKMIMAGEHVFKLHDTYGFPLDLTKEILAEKGIGVDEEKFYELMKNQREKARANQAFKGGWSDSVADALSGFTTEFVGYDQLSTETEILAILKDGELSTSAEEGESIAVVIGTTPFYAESGGQIGDEGIISHLDNKIKVTDTKKIPSGQFICYGQVETGAFTVGDGVLATVNEKKRMATMRNHTTAHILQAALRQVLGDHVVQAGSYVDPYKCRFDFSHFSSVTNSEIMKIEEICNDVILSALPVKVEEMSIDKAKEKGAIALFGEKYGDVVRTVDIEGFSMEFCGGTHVDNTAKIGLMKISSETSVAAGVRRIEVITGENVLVAFNLAKNTIEKASTALKLANPLELVNRCNQVMGELSEKDKKIDSLSQQIANSQLGDIAPVGEISGIKLITAFLEGSSVPELRKAGDTIKSKFDSYIILVAATHQGKGNLLCLCSKDAVAKGGNAGTIVREISAIAGGRGGGKPDQAMAGFSDLSKTKLALDSLVEVATKIIK